MDERQFDRLTRRFVLGSLAAALGLGMERLLDPASAKKRKKRKKRKKVKRNEFGCVNVGNFCKNDDQCCSGICRGKKGKKKCQAHDTGGCQPGIQDTGCDQTGGTDVRCTTSLGVADKVCGTTTGGAGYCGGGPCFPCKKDADCQQFCGPRAACVVCNDCTSEGGTACVNPEDPDCFAFLP